MNRAKAVLDIYEKYNYDLDRQQTKYAEAKKIIRNISSVKIKPKGKLLDVGCGIGIIGNEVKHKYDLDVYGLDLAKSAVDLSNKIGIKATLGDIDKRWPYDDKFFDTVLGVEVIEHVFSPDNFLEESFRVLKKNGLLIITTPNLAAWYNRFLFLCGVQPFFTEVSTRDKTMGLKFTRTMTVNREPLGHIRVFPLRSLIHMLDEYGFEPIFIKGSPVDYFPSFLSYFDKIFSLIPSLASDLTVVAKKK